MTNPSHTARATPEPDAQVLVVDLAKRFGGTDVRVLQLADALQGHVTVATLAGSPLDRRLRASGHRRLVISRRRGDPRIVRDLARCVRDRGVCVLDAHNPQSQFWALLAGLIARVPVRVTTVHSQYLAEHGGSPRGRFYELVLRVNRRCGSRFIAVSEATNEYLHSLGAKDAKLIPNAVPPAVRDPEGRGLVLGDWPADAYVIGVVARLEPVKGLDDFMEAMALLAPAHPRARCLVVGDGRSRASLEDLARRLGITDLVRFTGFRDDVGVLMAGLDAFCLPSHSEGLPFALLEACAHRLPLVVTEVGGMAALLEDGVSARVVPPRDPEGLAAGLATLLESPREAEAMAKRAHGMVRERFSLEAVIDATLAAYGLDRVAPPAEAPSDGG